MSFRLCLCFSGMMDPPPGFVRSLSHHPKCQENSPMLHGNRYPNNVWAKEGNSLGGLTRLCSGLRSGRDNLPLHIFCLQEMSPLVRHHPWEGGGKPLAERREKRSHLDLCQIEPC